MAKGGGSDKFYIAAYDKSSGLHTDLKPFQIPDKAFAACNNAYVWRNRVRKRFGSKWIGATQDLTRLRMNVATTAAVSGNLVATTMPGTIWAIGQMFSVGTTFFTVNIPNGATLTTGAATATYNTATGSLVITGNTENPSTIVYFYPSTPVMGLITYESININNETTIAFDTQFAYRYTTGWQRISAENAPGDSVWTGSDSQFFWGYSYGGFSPSDYVLYVTNFNQNEPNFMRYMLDVAGTLTWFSYRPTLSLTTSGATLNIYLVAARILIPFHNRLLAFNTWELQDDGNLPAELVHYPFRVRWTWQDKDPTDQVNAWREDISTAGFGLDASTLEAIITVEFLRDRLMVYFERSTWELVYTGNQVSPFSWQQINTELGAESTFSVVPFDSVSLGVGNEGIIACSGTNVERIDNSIPNTVFAIHNGTDGPKRVYGIRDYTTEMVWWTLPDPTANTDFPYPKKVLVYNYKNGTWSFNDDSITCFGYFQPVTGVSWDSTVINWDDAISWDSGSMQSQFRFVIAGNQQGFTFLIDPDIPVNASALQITDLTVVIPGINLISVSAVNFNFNDGDYIYLEGIQGTGNMNLLNGTIQRVILNLVDSVNFTFIVGDDTIAPIAGTYKGGGLISRVSQIDIETKAFNFYQKAGRNSSINKIDFLVDSTTAGAILVDYYISNNVNPMVRAASSGTGTGSLLGSSILETSPYASIPFEANSTQLWHSIYTMAQGEFIQLNLYLNNEQMRNVDVRESPFQLHAMIFTAQSTSRLE